MPAAGTCPAGAGVVSVMTGPFLGGCRVHDAMVERGQVTPHHRDPVTAGASACGRRPAAAVPGRVVRGEPAFDSGSRGFGLDHRRVPRLVFARAANPRLPIGPGPAPPPPVAAQGGPVP